MTQILIIDDDLAIQTLLARSLSRCGYQVSTASNGEAGLCQIKESYPALVICDWLMPGINGLEVCRRLKAIPELSATFFILVTALDSVADRVKGLDAGADDFLSKPIEINELQARVRAGLRLYQLSRDLQQQKELLELEMKEAAEYVCSILPEPLATSFLSVDTRFIPSRQLGGDSFDFYWLDANHLAIYLLDVAGHGLRAALPSLSVLNLLRSRGLEQVNYYRPNEVLNGLNQTFQMTQRNDKFFTIWYGIYDRRQRTLTYSCAGHPPAILLSRNRQVGVIETHLKTTGFPIGMFADAEYVNASCPVHSPSSLYVFSDGIYESEKSNGEMLGLFGFIEILKKFYQESKNDLDLILSNIQKDNSKSQFDDDLSILKIDFY
jgi:sigma-B regulation protein RsbU (phosphoserine phosphatase)